MTPIVMDHFHSRDIIAVAGSVALTCVLEITRVLATFKVETHHMTLLEHSAAALQIIGSYFLAIYLFLLLKAFILRSGIRPAQ